MGDIAIGRAIDDDLGTNAPQPTLAGANNTEHPGIVRVMVIDDGIDDHGVQQQFHSRLDAHALRRDLRRLRLERGHLVVAVDDEAAIGRTCRDRTRMQRAAERHHPLNEFFVDAADQLLAAVERIGGHAGADEARREVTAEEAVALHKAYPHTKTCRRDRRR